jgi:hypothetical protein
LLRTMALCSQTVRHTKAYPQHEACRACDPFTSDPKQQAAARGSHKEANESDESDETEFRRT